MCWVSLPIAIAKKRRRVICRDRNGSLQVTALPSGNLLAKNQYKAIVSYVVVSSATIATRARRFVVVIERKILCHRTKAANSDRTSSSTIEIWTPSGGKNCAADYFLGKHRGKQRYNSGKCHSCRGGLSWGVGYAEVRYEGLYCNAFCVKKVVYHDAILGICPQGHFFLYFPWYHANLFMKI